MFLHDSPMNQTLLEIKVGTSVLAHGAGWCEETQKVSGVPQCRANPSHTGDTSCKGSGPTVPEYLSLMQKRLSVPQGLLCLSFFFLQPVKGSSPSNVTMNTLPGMLTSPETVFGSRLLDYRCIPLQVRA